MKKPEQERTVRLTPREYLRHVAHGLDRITVLRSPRILVCGDLRLSGDLDLVELPAASVSGSVAVENCPSLESARISAAGSMSILGCPSLKLLAGCGQDVELAGVGLSSLGADFECRGDMSIVDSPSLSRINCRVGLSLVMKGGGRVSVGPAFSCGVALVLHGDMVVVDAQGRSHAAPPGSPPRVMVGRRIAAPLAPPRKTPRRPVPAPRPIASM